MGNSDRCIRQCLHYNPGSFTILAHYNPGYIYSLGYLTILATLQSLPNEVTIKVLAYLNSKHLIRCSRVCKKLYQMINDPNSQLWKERFEETGSVQFRQSPIIRSLESYQAKVRAFECAWNESDCSPNITINPDCLTLHRKPVAQSTDAVRTKSGFTQGQHYFTIVYHGPNFGSSALVGVCTKHASLHTNNYEPLLGDSKEGWAWDLSKRMLRHDKMEFGSYPEQQEVR